VLVSQCIVTITVNLRLISSLTYLLTYLCMGATPLQPGAGLHAAVQLHCSKGSLHSADKPTDVWLSVCRDAKLLAVTKDESREKELHSELQVLKVTSLCCLLTYLLQCNWVLQCERHGIRPAVTNCPYYATSLAHTTVGRFLLLALLSGTHCPKTFGIRSVVLTVTDSRWRHFYFRSTSVFSALEVFYVNALYKFTYDIYTTTPSLLSCSVLEIDKWHSMNIHELARPIVM